MRDKKEKSQMNGFIKRRRTEEKGKNKRNKSRLQRIEQKIEIIIHPGTYASRFKT